MNSRLSFCESRSQEILREEKIIQFEAALIKIAKRSRFERGELSENFDQNDYEIFELLSRRNKILP